MAHKTRSCKPNLDQNLPLWEGRGRKGLCASLISATVWSAIFCASFPHLISTAASRRPTYGELIDLLEKSEKEAPLDYEALCSENFNDYILIFESLVPKDFMTQTAKYFHQKTGYMVTKS